MIHLKRTFWIVVSLLTVSCSPTTTKIYTRPGGAELIMDDELSLGTSPIALTEPVWIWTRHSIKASLPGFQTRTIEIENTGFNAGGTIACVCTAGILLPLFFRSSYLPQYLVELAPEEKASTDIQLDEPLSFHE